MDYIRRISAHESAQIGILLWWAIALAHTSASIRATTPIYRKMVEYLPFWAWVLLPLVIVAALLITSVANRQRELGWTVVVVAAWWAVITYLLWSVSRAYLTPGFALIFALAAMRRYGEVRRPHER